MVNVHGHSHVLNCKDLKYMGDDDLEIIEFLSFVW